MSDLKQLLDKQRELQIKHYGADPADLEGEERIQFLKDMAMALNKEIEGELLDEVGWKPWASSKHVNEEAAQGEAIDGLHFLLNIFLALRMDEFMIMDKYMNKNKKNAQRQIDGYDGIAGKCPGCGRAMDDDAVQCREMMVPIQIANNNKEYTPGYWCDEKRTHLL